MSFKSGSSITPLMQSNALITVWLDVPPEHEAEFTDWYRLEHIPQVVGLPGFISARRYKVDDAPLKYLAWYDTADESIVSGADFMRIVNHPTPWSQRMRSLYGENRERMNFKLAPGARRRPPGR
jgi:hypothetical protein